MTSMNARRIGFLFALFLLAGCADNRRNLAFEVASGARMSGEWLAAGQTHLMTWRRIDRPGAELTVYIEGDGFAYETLYRASADPTPRTQLVLRLAALQQEGNVAYLARPCMYFEPDRPFPECRTPLWWTLGRFSEEVVAAMNLAIDDLKKRAVAEKLHLVGYSGGGAIAALIAARRTDVASLRTLAGNLDHEAFTSFHKVTPLEKSLNPVQVAPKLARLPQIHFVGTKDDIVPGLVVQSFVKAVGEGRCVRVVEEQGVTHHDGWGDFWARWHKTMPKCNDK
ncbi:MAG: alpha/beta hydrolase [Magnetococcales bacterium]|nr:alpha/beta hydrolase [Magnetococcales bacterium]